MKGISSIPVMLSSLRGLPSTLGRVLPFLAIGVVLLFLSVMIFGSSRSFLVEAKTDGLQIAFGKGQNVWRLPDATLCVPVEIPLLEPDVICGQAASPEGPLREWILDWSDEAVVDLSALSGGGLSVRVVVPGESLLPVGAELIIPDTAWTSTGALTFRASVTLGQDMRTGASKFLHEGRWEAREAGIATSLFRSLTEVVKSGELSKGSKVTVLSKGIPAKVFGHVTPAEGNSLSVTMISELGDTSLSVRHFGLDDHVLIEPDWIDIAISSPLLLAVAIIFSVLASITQIISDSSGAVQKIQKPAGMLNRQKANSANSSVAGAKEADASVENDS